MTNNDDINAAEDIDILCQLFRLTYTEESDCIGIQFIFLEDNESKFDSD